MKKWEHRVSWKRINPADLRTFLNGFGDGWQLASYVREKLTVDEYLYEVVMKREIPESTSLLEAPEVSPEAEEHPNDR